MPSASKPNTIEAAKGRWPGILEALGIDPKYLVDRHGPCPMCGGTDRWRFDDKEGSGSFFCSGCGPGTGIQLIQRFHGWDFKRAADEIDAIVGNVELASKREAQTIEQKMAAIKRLLSEARKVEPGDPVWSYLSRRGCFQVREDLGDIRYHPALAHPSCGGAHPAMLAILRAPGDEKNNGVSLHRTFLTLDGAKADVQPVRMLMPGKSIAGAAIRLDAENDTMGIAEGIETALCASCLTGKINPVWSAVSANGLSCWEPPACLKRLTIYADHDANFTGQQAAFTLARRLALKGIEVEVKIPERAGSDWADEENWRKT